MKNIIGWIFHRKPEPYSDQEAAKRALDGSDALTQALSDMTPERLPDADNLLLDAVKIGITEAEVPEPVTDNTINPQSSSEDHRRVASEMLDELKAAETYELSLIEQENKDHASLVEQMAQSHADKINGHDKELIDIRLKMRAYSAMLGAFAPEPPTVLLTAVNDDPDNPNSPMHGEPQASSEPEPGTAASPLPPPEPAKPLRAPRAPSRSHKA